MHITLIGAFVGACLAGLLWWLGGIVIAKIAPKDPFDRLASIALICICILIFVGFTLGRIPLPSVTL